MKVIAKLPTQQVSLMTLQVAAKLQVDQVRVRQDNVQVRTAAIEVLAMLPAEQLAVVTNELRGALQDVDLGVRMSAQRVWDQKNLSQFD